jgi:TRAP-type mannitol/chloroaromatic compound transport system permease small subunit
MKTLKKLLIICLIFLIPFSFLYLCVSFFYVDFNFANWRASTRGAITFYASLASFISLALYLAYPPEDELKASLEARPYLRIVK